MDKSCFYPEQPSSDAENACPTRVLRGDPFASEQYAGRLRIAQDAGQGDYQSKRQDQPKECYERDAHLPACRVYEIVPKALNTASSCQTSVDFHLELTHAGA